MLRALGVAALLAALAACSQSTQAGSDGAPVAATSEAVKARTAHPRSLADAGAALALEDASLTVDQRARVEAVRAELSAASASEKTARVALADRLAAQIMAGALDRAALEPYMTAIEAARAANEPAEQKALGDLHAALTSGQRARLVAAARTKLEGHAFRDDGKERLEQVADELELSDTQRRAIKARVVAQLGAHFADHEREHGEFKARAEAIAQAFASESFDAATLDVGKDASAFMRPMGEAMLTLVEATLPELSATQRAKLAEHVRARASSG
jgi:Spy/CpxP family protein refolding chaperone